MGSQIQCTLALKKPNPDLYRAISFSRAAEAFLHSGMFLQERPAFFTWMGFIE